LSRAEKGLDFCNYLALRISTHLYDLGFEAGGNVRLEVLDGIEAENVRDGYRWEEGVPDWSFKSGLYASTHTPK
jgi:hypothetical protein